MDQNNYKSGMEEAEANAALNDVANDKLRFCTDELKKEIVRTIRSFWNCVWLFSVPIYQGKNFSSSRSHALC